MDKEELTNIFARNEGEARMRTSERYVMLDLGGRTFYFLPTDEGGRYDGYSEEATKAHGHPTAAELRRGVGVT